MVTPISNNYRFLVFAEDAAEGVGDFADRSVGFDGCEDGGEKILGRSGAALKLIEYGANARRIAFGAKSLQARDLGAFDFRVDAENGNAAVVVFFDEVVHADDDLFFGFDGALKFVSRFLNFSLDEAGFNRAKHAAHGIDFGDVFFRATFNFIGEGFDSVGAADGIDGVGDAGFAGDDLLGAEGDKGGVFGGKSESFIERIGVKRLAATKNSGERLNGDADDVVLWLLRCERRTSRLRVEA